MSLTPEDAGWEWTGLRVVRLSPGATVRVETGPSELFVLPLRGSVRLEVAHQDEPGTTEAKFDLDGRASVFSAVTDFAYVGRDSVVSLQSDGVAELALPAVALQHPSRGPLRRRVRRARRDAWRRQRQPPGQQLRRARGLGPRREADRRRAGHARPGTGRATRRTSTTPREPCEVVNEEIYYYRIAGPDQVTPSRDGHGYHRTYTGPEHEAVGLDGDRRDLEVHDHDVVLIPHGYHGPCMASTGYPMYYLNVMAGPGEDRAMAFCDDPDPRLDPRQLGRRRGRPRCPVTSAAGRADGLVPSYDDDAEETR